MNERLKGSKIAFLVTKGFEQDELSLPRTALRDAGAETFIVAPDEGRVLAWRGKEWGWEFPVDVKLERARADDYDGLVIPGGVMSPDQLRTNDTAVALVHDFVATGKPIASICHGPWLLIDAEGVRGRKLTSYPSLRRDLINAGGEWFDAPVVIDSNLVTSRRPKDLPAFVDATIDLFAKGRPAAVREETGSA